MSEHVEQAGRRTPLLKLSALAGIALGLTLPGGVAQSLPPPTQHTVVMANMSYGRLPTVKVGDTIVWVNKDTVPHTATARNKSFDVRLQTRKSARMVVRKAGTLPIYCIYHPAMRGTLKVVQ